MSTTKQGRGILTVVSGFSGAGKGTLVNALVNNYPDQYGLSVSATTRKPRPGEKEGREYFFKTIEQFEQMIEEGQLIEYARYVDNYYGTPKTYVMDQLEKGTDVILEIEVQGALKVKEQYPDTLLLFVTPPDAGTLVSRLRGRGSETEEMIAKRLRTAYREADFMPEYDFIIVNDVLEECVEHTHGLIQRHHGRPKQAEAFIKEIKQQLKEQVKGEEN